MSDQIFNGDQKGSTMNTITTYDDLVMLDQQIQQQGVNMRTQPLDIGLTMEQSLQAQKLCEAMDRSLADYLGEDGQVDINTLLEDAMASDIPELTSFSYLTRGAKLKCRFGSHIRMLNLPTCHGVYTMNCPMAHELDCIPGDTQNITTFGVCSSPNNPQQGEILLQKVQYDEKGNAVKERFGENVKGKPCIPLIIGYWMAAYHRTYIAKNIGADNLGVCGACPKAVKGDQAYASITTNSFLVCSCGGLIEPLTGGTEYYDEHQGYPPGTQFIGPAEPTAPAIETR